MKSILIANLKGGCGKTTLSTTLAAALAVRGHAVALADADGQKSALAWGKARPEGAAPVTMLDWSKAKRVGDAPKGLDYLIIDAPGAMDGDEAAALIAEADVLLIPVQPSFYDEEATKRFLKRIEDVKTLRKGRASLHLIANRMKATAKARAELDGFLARMGRPALAEISDRAAYGTLAPLGLTPFDKGGKANAAIQADWDGVLGVVE